LSPTQARPTKPQSQGNVSIVIPTLNEEERIAETLKPVGKYEVILVDGGSRDRTVEIARRLGARAFQCRGLNIAQARNFGSHLSTRDILIQLDADTIVRNGAIKAIISSFKNPRVVGGTCKLYPYDGEWYHKLYYCLVNLSLFSLSFIPSSTRALVNGSVLFMRRNVFERIGGYWNNEVSDDQYISRCLAKAGKFVFLNSITVYTSARRWKKLGFWKTIRIHLENFICFFFLNRTKAQKWEKLT